jgi:uncharacterized protein YbjT (DUF2867 family)
MLRHRTSPEGQAVILVVGATGKVGQEVVRQLSAADVPARALVRDPVRASHIRLPGVQIVVGDLARPESLDPALSGVDRVFLASPADPEQVTLQGNLVQACNRAGVRHVVKVSVAGGPDAATQIGRWHWTTEKQIEASGLGFTMLRPNLYMQQTLRFAASVASSGSFSLPCGAGEVSIVDARDVASVAVCALTQPGHDRKIYDLTGPEALSFDAMADAIGQAIDRKVAYVHVPPEYGRKQMLADGVPRWLADDMLVLFASIREGYGGTVSDAVPRVTGKKARTFQQFARDYAQAFRDGRSQVN